MRRFLIRYQDRLDRVMTEVQSYYAAEMAARGMERLAQRRAAAGAWELVFLDENLTSHLRHPRLVALCSPHRFRASSVTR